MLVEKEPVKEIWVECCEGLLNIEDDRKAEIVVVEREDGVKVLRGLNNADITQKEEQGVVKKMKAGKAAGLVGCAVECLKSEIE